MTEGDIALVSLPQADGRTKNRPVVLLRALPPHGDFLVCGVTSRLRHQVVGLDDIVREIDPDYSGSGLKQPSLIRLGYLASLPVSEFLGTIGSISPARHRELLRRLSALLAPVGD